MWYCQLSRIHKWGILIVSTENTYSDVGLMNSCCIFHPKKTYFQDSTATLACLDTDDAVAPNISEEMNEKDLFKKYQEIRHQDFGEIVFRKQKRSRKKSNKGTLMSNERGGGVVARLVGCRSRWSVSKTETKDFAPRCLSPPMGKKRDARPTHFNVHLFVLFVYV